MNVYAYNINEESKLQINDYKKQELERNQLLQQMNEFSTGIQHDDIIPKNTQLMPSKQKGIATAKSTIWILNSFSIRVSCLYRKTKKALITDVISFTEKVS